MGDDVVLGYFGHLHEQHEGRDEQLLMMMMMWVYNRAIFSKTTTFSKLNGHFTKEKCAKMVKNVP